MTQHTATIAQLQTDGYNVRLPVLPWVRKVLLAQFGAEPINVHGHSVLGKALESLPFEFPSQDERPDLAVHCSSILLRVSRQVWGSVRSYEHLFKAGFFYEKAIQQQMISHIVAQERCGVANLTALRDWFEMYDLDIDDDYNIEAAYWLWKSFKARRRG